MKIIYLTTGLGLGGAEKLTVDLADSAASDGHDVTIIFLTGRIQVTPRSSSIEIISLEMKSKWSLINSLKKFKKLIDDIQPDVVHSHMVHANLFARISRLFVKIPRLICTAHSVNEGGVLRMLGYRITDSLANMTTNVSSEATEFFIKHKAAPCNKIITVPNGINTNVFKFNSNARDQLTRELGIKNQKILLAVGRLVAAKDYPNLINAIAILKKKRADFIVLIAGEGDLKNNLYQLTLTLGVNENIIFLGNRDDIPKLLSASDVFVLASEWEGMPLVFGEAMACGCLVAATDCGGVKDFIGDIDTLVPVKNSSLLAEKLDEHLNLGRASAQSYGSACRERIIKNFSIQTTYENYCRLYVQ